MASPVAQLQARWFNKEQTFRLLTDINALLEPERRLEHARLRRCFETNWPALAKLMEEIPPAEGEPPQRDSADILNEILQHVRSSSRSRGRRPAHVPVTAFVGPSTDLVYLERNHPEALLSDLGEWLDEHTTRIPTAIDRHHFEKCIEQAAANGAAITEKWHDVLLMFAVNEGDDETLYTCRVWTIGTHVREAGGMGGGFM